MDPATAKIIIAAAKDKRVQKTVIGIVVGVVCGVLFIGMLCLQPLMWLVPDNDPTLAAILTQAEEINEKHKAVIVSTNEATGVYAVLFADSDIRETEEFTKKFVNCFVSGDKGHALDITLKNVSDTFSLDITDEQKTLINNAIQNYYTVTDNKDVLYPPLTCDWQKHITSPYGWRWGRLHKGVDISYGTDMYGDPVYASISGTVAYVRYEPDGYGYYLRIDNEETGVSVLYAHLAAVYVSGGQTVNAGELTAAVGNSGYCVPAPTIDNPRAGTHLHYEVWLGGEEIDPLLKEYAQPTGGTSS